VENGVKKGGQKKKQMEKKPMEGLDEAWKMGIE
jgi:hypothetical protein